MIIVLVIAVGLGWVVQRARVQRDAVAAIEKVGGTVAYDFQRPIGMPNNSKGEPNWPRWLVDRLGVDYFGNVVSASLSKNADDAIMSHLGRLARLREVQIGGSASELTDAGAANLAGLVQLENVSFRPRDSKITGEVLANFQSMTKLKLLHISGFPISDANLGHLEQLTSLENLDLSHSQVSDAGLAHLAGLINLQVLNLNLTRISGPGLRHLQAMQQLRILWLIGNPVQDLSALPMLPRLKTLSLDRTPVGDLQLSSMPDLPALESLNLGHTKMTDAGVVSLQRFNGSLKILSLSGAKITDAAADTILKLVNLTRISLDDTRITDATLDKLAAMKGLTTLNVDKTGVTDAGLARLRTAIPQMQLAKEAAARRVQNQAGVATNQQPSQPRTREPQK